MRPKLARLRTIALAVFVAAALVLVLTGRGHHHSATATTTSPASAPPQPLKRPNPPAVKSRVRPALKSRVVGFLEAYYRILPGDTAAARRRRVTPYVTTQLLGRLGFGPSRLTEPAVQSQVSTSQMSIRRLGGTDIRQVSVPVLIYVRRGDLTESYITVDTTSRWQFRAGRWVAVAFN